MLHLWLVAISVGSVTVNYLRLNKTDKTVAAHIVVLGSAIMAGMIPSRAFLVH